VAVDRFTAMEHSAVLYQPDKGAAFGHALRPSKAAGAWKGVQRFLDDLADGVRPSGVRLVAYRATTWDDPNVVAPIVDSVVSRFGEAMTVVGGGMNVTTGMPVAGGYLEWRGDETSWLDFVQFVVAGHPWPKTTLGPVSAEASFRFHWKPGVAPMHGDPSDSPLHSELGITLARTSYVQPRLWFPHPAGSPELSELVRLVMKIAPFRLSARHFRTATPKKDGSGYRFRRFDAESWFAT
jgi:hypothetical protein